MPINNNNSVDKSAHRPVFLNLLVIRLPIGGVVSILHRVSGVVLVLLTPPCIYLLDRSLSDPAFFLQLQQWLGLGWIKVSVFLVAGLLFQHFFSGVRHLALDIDWGISRRAARISAWLTFAGTTLLLIAMGLWWQ